MKRCLFLAIAIAITSASSAVAQRDLFRQLENEVRQQSQQFRQQGRQFIEQEFGRFRNPNQGSDNQVQPNGAGSFSLPSEGGSNSGGRGRIFNPGDQGFMLPGGGGQPFRPNPGFQQPGNPFPGQTIYPGQTFNPGQNMGYPNGQIIGQPGGQVITSNPGVSTYVGNSPTIPVMSNQYIMIRCPQNTTGSIGYTLSSNGQNFSFTISPGQEQRFPLGSGWTISYNHGGEQKRYRLEGGKIYTMKQDSEQRWNLFAAR